jgi:tetratricopeptide (TPR) repeat protein
LKRFEVNLPPGDSVNLKADFGTGANTFCIVRAMGPPEGVTACSDRTRSADSTISACTHTIESGHVLGKVLAAVYFHRADAYASNGDSARAIAHYSETIRLNPTLGGAFFFRGLEYSHQHQYERAISDYSEAIRLNRNVGPSALSTAYSLRAEAYEGKRDHQNAISDYTEAINLNPKDPKLYIGRSRAFRQMGNSERAIADEVQVIRLGSKNIAPDPSR